MLYSTLNSINNIWSHILGTKLWVDSNFFNLELEVQGFDRNPVKFEETWRRKNRFACRLSYVE